MCSQIMKQLPVAYLVIVCLVGWCGKEASAFSKLRLMHHDTAATVAIQQPVSIQHGIRGQQQPIRHVSSTRCYNMKRPILDQLATTLFRLETDRVNNAAEIDEQGRVGEPMAWSEPNSWANTFSEIMAQQGYGFKQWVADIVAGEYDAEQVRGRMQNLIDTHAIVMFSFTTCPFCRRAKDALDARGESYVTLELDEDSEGNALRAMLGKLTQRTSVPSIFVKGTCIGGCNDGPGLLPLLDNGEFDALMGRTTP